MGQKKLCNSKDDYAQFICEKLGSGWAIPAGWDEKQYQRMTDIFGSPTSFPCLVHFWYESPNDGHENYGFSTPRACFGVERATTTLIAFKSRNY